MSGMFGGMFGGNRQQQQVPNNQNGNNNPNGNNNNNNNNNGNPGGQNNGSGNNNGNTESNIIGIWGEPENKTAGNNNGNLENQNGGNNNNNNGGSGGTTKTSAQQFDEYVSSIDWGVKVGQEQIDKLKSGDLSALPEIFKPVMESVYKKAMTDTAQMLNSKIDGAVAEAVRKANGDRHIDQIISDMNRKLPLTLDPDIAPVAKAALGRQIQAGKSPDEAIANVGRLMDKIAGATGRNQNKQPGSGFFSNGNNNTNFGANGGSGNEDTDFVNWLTGQ